ncbi:hypothetical protein A9G45_10980 [Gilliamella sp. HK2]|uniref:peptidoglycan-binding domain-containing protein n=2 Tax=unclassified Gilliamella TaxID=2685620 RepID=UPI00080EE08F|nr:peptidoglycan-binding domain-containing protein [Gilliamella apicola]OCG26344.1 hypothetical protein A9G45_10980 [Gilliamella apicola]
MAVDDANPDSVWRYIQALNQQGVLIQGWVNITAGAQAHIKLVSPWHWPGFETIEEKASIGELSNKIGKNKVAKLDLEDYTPAMQELHQILTGTLRYSNQRKKTHLPSFTDNYLKEGLRRSWAAERIGHLLVKYESEWYADEALSKWNEIDELFEEEKQQKKESIEAILDKIGIIEPYHRDFAMKKVDEALEHVKSNWQLEKEQRIKPSLWWKEVAQAQAQNPTANTDANTPKLSNLSADGKAWFIHPVAMIDYFPKSEILFQKGDKHEIIREINIRLAGFGGNVPTDEFTERTEKMIKQFQRDYMQVEETGVVDIKVIQAIDRFQEEYTINNTIWLQLKCRCSPKQCSGFGNGSGKNTSPEQFNKYEYPGLHRSLLFGFCALNFYLSRQNVYKFREISSGYRCSLHKEGGTTSNHRGKALDIQFNKGNWEIRHRFYINIEPLMYIRDNFFATYLNAQNKWANSNLFSTEPIGLKKDNSIIDRNHTYSWIHMDVRSFEKQYLLDEYFCTDAATLNKEKLITLINK